MSNFLRWDGKHFKELPFKGKEQRQEGKYLWSKSKSRAALIDFNGSFR